MRTLAALALCAWVTARGTAVVEKLPGGHAPGPRAQEAPGVILDPLAPGDDLTMVQARYTRAVSPARRSAAWSSVSCFLQNAKRIMFFPRPLPAW